MAVANPNATATPANAGTDKKATNDVFANEGQAARANLTEDQKAMEGSKSDKVAFICALGDPQQKQKRVEKGQSLNSNRVVGFKFNLLEPMKIPNAPLKENYSSLIDCEPITEIEHPAGEVTLNLLETGAFISRFEFAGSFTGGERPVYLSAKSSKDREEPLPILHRLDGGSVKDNLELIGKFDKSANPVIRECFPQYQEKFGVLFKRKRASRTGGAAPRVKGERTKNIAAAFRNLYEGKKA